MLILFDFLIIHYIASISPSSEVNIDNLVVRSGN